MLILLGRSYLSSFYNASLHAAPNNLITPSKTQDLRTVHLTYPRNHNISHKKLTGAKCCVVSRFNERDERQRWQEALSLQAGLDEGLVLSHLNIRQGLITLQGG